MPTSFSGLQIDEGDAYMRLTMDLPDGVRGSDLDVSVQQGFLCIQGCRIIRGMDGRIRKKQRLDRRFPVDTDVVDVSKASADVLSNGVLVISAPKKTYQPKMIFNIPVNECNVGCVSDDDETSVMIEEIEDSDDDIIGVVY